jgi:hypothetical protein
MKGRGAWSIRGKVQPRARATAENAALCQSQGRFLPLISASPPLCAASAAGLSCCLPLLAAPSPPASPAARAHLDDSASLDDCVIFAPVMRIPFPPPIFRTRSSRPRVLYYSMRYSTKMHIILTNITHSVGSTNLNATFGWIREYYSTGHLMRRLLVETKRPA